MDEDGWRKGYTRHVCGGRERQSFRTLAYRHPDIHTSECMKTGGLAGWRRDGLTGESFVFPPTATHTLTLILTHGMFCLYIS